MANDTWKKRERQIATFFGTSRNPLSGSASRHSESDSLHPALFIEDKHRKKHSVVTLWDDTKKKATKEGKIPVVCLTEHNRPGFWVMVHSEDLQKVSKWTSPHK